MSSNSEAELMAVRAFKLKTIDVEIKLTNHAETHISRFRAFGCNVGSSIKLINMYTRKLCILSKARVMQTRSSSG